MHWPHLLAKTAEDSRTPRRFAMSSTLEGGSQLVFAGLRQGLRSKSLMGSSRHLSHPPELVLNQAIMVN